MPDNMTLVHVTHEAVGKVGGIGAVLQGLFTCNPYLESVERSILIGPLFSTEGTVLDRLGEGGEVLYSSLDGFINTGYHAAFHRIEGFYNARIIYGRRTFIDERTGVRSSPEVLLIDVTRMDKGPVDEFKRQLFEQFGIRSDLYENLWEYEQYTRMAPVAIAALKAIGAANDSTVVVAHEYMGMPTALAAQLDHSCNFKTVFYAHEVATMRRIVENHPGHDTMFYNTMKRAYHQRLYVSDVFGNQDSYFKHPLVDAAKYCDLICAVGPQVAEELRFLAPEFEAADIRIVYNGIPAYQVSVSERLAARERLGKYCCNLLGYKPDVIFTHVTRLVRSKGLWRDLRVLEHIERQFRRDGRTAVMFLLSTEVSQRRSSDIYDIEAKYNWPVAHREGWPDLSGGEAQFYTALQEFNARSRNTKVIFINQFGFSPKHCGRRMPQDMEFMDIRRGTDVEFGQSIYEPFGIAQLEALCFGGICVYTGVCGCSGFVGDAIASVLAEHTEVDNIIVADYTNLDTHNLPDVEDLIQLDQEVRNRIEAVESEKVAGEILRRLPKTKSATEQMIEIGSSLAKHMNWDVVVQDYLMEGLRQVFSKRRMKDAAA